MEAESRISINSLFKQCLEKLQKLLNSIPDERSDASLTVQDDLGRLRVWIGNFGAHRKPTDRLSLDHRLREAPDLHREVCNHINDISEAIQAAIPLLSQNLSKPPSNENLLGIGQISLESRPEDINSGSESSDSDSDEFWDQIRAENDIHSELDEYLQDIRFTISSLYKFSLTLQNPAHRDLTSRASRIDLSHFEFYDIQHVSDKFNLSTDSVLAQRLGRANTKRRQLLAYYKEHVGKISRHLDIVVAKAIEMPMDLPKDKEIFKAPQSISTKWTQDTTVSTIIPLEIDSRSDSARTKFSVTSSATGDQQIPLMPPPPHQHPESDAGKIPFFCPYCHQTIQLENMDQDWDYHVYSDLRPYICTFAGCIKPDQIYDSYTEWSEHERQQHRREWFCNLCSTNYQSGQSILLHFGEAHGEAVPEEQRQALVQLSERAVSSPQQCPLCTKSPISNPRRYQEHLARHLQQLSLFALPRLDSKEADGISRDGASDESNRPLAFDDEDHQSLRSTPSQDSLPVERTPSPRLDSTFVLPIGGIGAKNDDMTEEPLGKEDRLVDLNDTKNLGSNKEDSVLNLQGLAKLYWRQANLEKTESLLIQVLRIRQETLGADHKDTLSSTEDLALLEHVRSRLQYAESRLMPVTETRQPNFGLDNGDSLLSMQSLAKAYERQGHFANAEILLLEVIGTRKAILGENHEDTLSSMEKLAWTYRVYNQFDKAESVTMHVLEARKASLGPDHQDTLSSMENLAGLYQKQGHFNKAEGLCVQVMETRKAKLGADHPDTLESMKNLAEQYQNQGHLDKAELLFLEVIETRKAILGEDHHDTLSSMEKLALHYGVCNQWDKAEILSLQVIETRKASLSSDHRDTLRSMESLASLYAWQSDFAKAESILTQVMESVQASLGVDHHDTRRSMESLALNYQNQGLWDKAEELLVRVMTIQEKSLGKDHIDTIQSMENLAIFYEKHPGGHLEDAEQLFIQVVDSRKAVLGEDHPDTTGSMDSLALVYRDRGRLQDAEHLFEQAWQSHRKVLGEHHHDTTTSMTNLAKVYRDRGRLQDAEHLFEQAWQSRRKVLGEYHPVTITSITNLALVYRDRGRLQDAEHLFEQAWQSHRERLSEYHPATITSMTNLALVYQDRGRLQDAEHLFEQAWQSRRKVLGEHHPDTTTSMTNLAKVYRDRGRLEDAINILMECNEIRERSPYYMEAEKVAWRKTLQDWQIEAANMDAEVPGLAN